MPNSWQIEGKYCLISGSTSGIGLATAEGLLRNGAEVTIMGRNERKAEQAIVYLRSETGEVPRDVLLADLSSLEGISDAANAYRSRQNRLDVLINNVGGFFLRHELSPDGIEMTLALNHLSYYGLTVGLVDMLRAAEAGRVIVVSSESHRGAHLDPEHVDPREGFPGYRGYGKSKLANVLFTYELARKLKGTQVTANALHPGFVATGIASKHSPLLLKPLIWAIYQLGMNPLEGAQTPLFLATSPAVQAQTGGYYIDLQRVPSSPESYDLGKANHLWNKTEEWTGMAGRGL